VHGGWNKTQLCEGFLTRPEQRLSHVGTMVIGDD
jgi:hypothetical protein